MCLPIGLFDSDHLYRNPVQFKVALPDSSSGCFWSSRWPPWFPYPPRTHNLGRHHPPMPGYSGRLQWGQRRRGRSGMGGTSSFQGTGEGVQPRASFTDSRSWRMYRGAATRDSNSRRMSGYAWRRQSRGQNPLNIGLPHTPPSSKNSAAMYETRRMSNSSIRSK